MFEKLKLFGEITEHYWLTKNTECDDYKKAHEAVENEITYLKTAYPDKFWNDDDPDYKKLTNNWHKSNA